MRGFFDGKIENAHKREDYDRMQPMLYWPREYRKIGEVIKE